MENTNVLIGTAMLTAIWDQTRKDNLELLKPFVTYLIGKNTNVEDKYKKSIEEFLKLKKPSVQLISTLIDKIVIDDEKNIEIVYFHFLNLDLHLSPNFPY